MEGVEQPFRFTGREWDEAAKLYHYRARAYDPSTGRFLQEDPIGFKAGDLNIYRYVENNPIGYKDPSGELAYEAAMGAEIGIENALAFEPVAQAIYCKFMTFADVFDQIGSGSGEVDVDFSDCGARLVANSLFNGPGESGDEYLDRQGNQVIVMAANEYAWNYIGELSSKIPATRVTVIIPGWTKAPWRNR